MVAKQIPADLFPDVFVVETEPQCTKLNLVRIVASTSNKFTPRFNDTCISMVGIGWWSKNHLAHGQNGFLVQFQQGRFWWIVQWEWCMMWFWRCWTKRGTVVIGYHGRIQATAKQWIDCSILDADDMCFEWWFRSWCVSDMNWILSLDAVWFVCCKVHYTCSKSYVNLWTSFRCERIGRRT